MKKTVLIVDDDVDLRDTIAVLLQDGIPDIEIACASDGGEALRLIQRDRPAVIVSDISMPVMDGIELLRRLGEARIFTPVILMTGYTALEKSRHAWRLGAYDYLEKPFKNEHLVMTVRLALEMGEDYNRNRYESRIGTSTSSPSSVRLDPQLMQRLSAHCKNLGQSVEDFVTALVKKELG